MGVIWLHLPVRRVVSIDVSVAQMGAMLDKRASSAQDLEAQKSEVGGLFVLLC